MKYSYYFSIACRFWGYKPHELEEREDKGFWVAEALKYRAAENIAQKIADKAAAQRAKLK